MSHETLLADELKDLKLDKDRQIFEGDEGDIALTHGVETVQQSIVINSGGVLRPLVGEPLTTETLENAQTELLEVLRNDPQVADVRRLEITEINQQTNTVKISVFVGFNNQFEIEATV